MSRSERGRGRLRLEQSLENQLADVLALIADRFAGKQRATRTRVFDVELATATAAGASHEGHALRVAADSPLERDLAAARFAPLGETKRRAKLEAERARAAAEAERE